MTIGEMESLCLKAIEKNIETYDIYTADKAFMTGTPFCILPVKSLNNVMIGNGKTGQVTKMLLDKWSENVGIDVVTQIKAFNKETENFSGPTPYRFG